MGYGFVAVVLTWPLVTVFSTHLAGHPFGDAYEYLRHIWWFKYALQHGQPLFFQPLLAYPDGLSGAWLWSVPLQSFPAWLFAFVMPLPAAFNLTLLLFLTLNGWAAYFLALYLLKSDDEDKVADTQLRVPTELSQPVGTPYWASVRSRHLAAWLAGLIYMTYPTFQGHIAAAHIGLLTQWGIPLYVYALFKLRETSARRYILLGALCFVMGLLGSTLLLIYALLSITILFLIRVVYENRRIEPQRTQRVKPTFSVSLSLRASVLMILIGGLFSLIFILPALLETGSVPVQLEGDVAFSADLLAVVTPSFQNPLFKALDYPSRVLGVDPFEKMAYIGIVAGMLAVIAFWRKREARWWLLLGVIAWVLSLGPVLKVFDQPVSANVGGYETLITLPWSYLMNLPLLDISRTPARFNFTLALAVAMMAGYGMQTMMMFTPSRAQDTSSKTDTQKRVPTSHVWASARIGLVLVLSVFILYEYLFFWEGASPNLPTIPGEIPSAIAVLSQRHDIRAVFDIPWSHPLTDKEAMFLQTGHQKPLLAGHIARATPVDPAKLTLLEQTLDPALLKAVGADIVILHKQWDDAEGVTESFVRSRLLDVIYEDESFAVFEAPATDDAPTLTTLPLPDTAIETHGDSFLYAPAPGWTVFTGKLTANNRQVSLRLNDRSIHRWMVDGEIEARVPVYLPQAGFYTLTLQVEPPCARSDNPALKCKTVDITGMAFALLQVADETQPVQFERGITLLSSLVQREGDQLRVWLDWNFDQPRLESDVRFVHVLDNAGNLITQQDNSLGALSAGGWSEEVTIELPFDLPSDTYRVEVGWYEYPAIAPFKVIESGQASLKIGEQGD